MTFVIALRSSLVVCALSILPLCPALWAYESNTVPATNVLAHTPTGDRLNTTELFSRLAARREWEQAQIKQLSALRNYNLKTGKGKTLATEMVLMEYRAPRQETFTTKSGKGSRYVRTHIFQRLMKFEAEKVRRGNNQDSLIAPQNYTLHLVGQDTIGTTKCLIVRAIPRRKERDLFEGLIWIDNQNFAIVKITGDLVKSPSFWVKHVHFVREYLRIGEFWLPSKEQAVSQVRIFGREMLTVEYSDYIINGASDGSISSERSASGARHSGK